METIERRPSPLNLSRDELVLFIDGVASHEVRLLLGVEANALSDELALHPPQRPMIWLSLASGGFLPEILESAVAQVARVLTGLWPYPWGEDFSSLRDDALSKAHLPIRLKALAETLPALSQSWAFAAVLQMLRGRSPRVRDAGLSLEWAQLVNAVSPCGLVLGMAFASDQPTADQTHALEWLAQHGDVALVALSQRMPQTSAIDRISYGARHVRTSPAPCVAEGLIIEQPGHSDPPVVLALPAPPEGRPHPMSPVEQRLYKLIQADDELRPLFMFNRTVPGLPLLQARVDLVWLEGRVAVEIDGHEHRAAAKYRADRHRDFELMCAGYRVLRITNEDVETDAALAVEKIRSVARLPRVEV